MDIEINGFPVDINMKLDDTGAAFFVEEMEEGEEEDEWLSNLATSPLPNQTLDWTQRRSNTLKPNPLFQSETKEPTTGCQEEDEEVLARVLADTTTGTGHLGEQDEGEEEDEDETPENSRVEDHVAGRKGKLNKKKRKRRRELRSRRGSKSNILPREMQTENETGDELFAMDDVIDLEQDSGLTPELPLSSQRSSRHLSAPSKDFDDADPQLEPLQAVFLEEAGNQDGLLTRTMSVKADFHYFPEMMLSDDQQESTRQAKPDTAPVADTLATEAVSGPEINVWRWGEPVMEVHQQVVTKEEVVVKVEPEPETRAPVVEVKEEEEKQSSWLGLFRGSRSSQPRDDTAGVYLDDIVNDPEKRALYLKPSPAPLEVCVGPSDPLDLSHIPRSGIDMPRDFDCESGNGPSLPMSPQTILVSPPTSSPASSTSSTKDLAALVSQHLPDLAVSLCGGLQDKSITPSQFNSALLTYSQFLERLKESSPVLADPNLVVRLEEKYVSWTTASPILLSLMFFKKPLPKETVELILKDGLPVNLNLSAEEATMQKSPKKDSSGWFGWFGGSSDQVPETEVKKELEEESEIKTEPEEDTSLTLAIPGTPRKRLETENTSSDSDLGDKRRWRKTLRLTSEQLASLNLEKGGNEVEFSVTTQFQGTTRARCFIYLWHHTDKVVISDIDGTITKSDVLGHFLPMVGRDWAQSGVADLFSKIRANGYHIMYLSARAIGQASMTKEYLESVRQGEVYLPEGPVFLNPDSLIHALKREVIDKNPEEFKIRCLKDIQNLFEGKNPFFAGYGNKPNVSANTQRLTSRHEYLSFPGCVCISSRGHSSLQNFHDQPCWRTEARAHAKLPNFVSKSFYFLLGLGW